MRQAESESERLNRPRPTFLRYHSGRGASILPLGNPSVVRELAERYDALTWQDPVSSTIGDRKSLSNCLPIIRAGSFGMYWHPSHGQTPGTLGHRLILEPRFTAHSLQASGSSAKFSKEARFGERIALEGKENYFRDPTTFTSERYFSHGSQIGSTGLCPNTGQSHLRLLVSSSGKRLCPRPPGIMFPVAYPDTSHRSTWSAARLHEDRPRDQSCRHHLALSQAAFEPSGGRARPRVTTYGFAP